MWYPYGTLSKRKEGVLVFPKTGQLRGPRESIQGESGLLDYDAAAQYLSTTPRHIRQLWNERKLAAVKVGRLVRFRRADLDSFIVQNLVEAV